MVRYGEDDPLGAETVARPDTSGSGAPPPPVEYVGPFDPPTMEEGRKGSGFGEILGRNENPCVIGLVSLVNVKSYEHEWWGAMSK